MRKIKLYQSSTQLSEMIREFFEEFGFCVDVISKEPDLEIELEMVNSREHIFLLDTSNEDLIASIVEKKLSNVMFITTPYFYFKFFQGKELKNVIVKPFDLEKLKDIIV